MKKFLSLFLVLALALALVPMSALAAPVTDTTKPLVYVTTENAYTAFVPGKYISGTLSGTTTAALTNQEITIGDVTCQYSCEIGATADDVGNAIVVAFTNKVGTTPSLIWGSLAYTGGKFTLTALDSVSAEDLSEAEFDFSLIIADGLTLSDPDENDGLKDPVPETKAFVNIFAKDDPDATVTIGTYNVTVTDDSATVVRADVTISDTDDLSSAYTKVAEALFEELEESATYPTENHIEGGLLIKKAANADAVWDVTVTQTLDSTKITPTLNAKAITFEDYEAAETEDALKALFLLGDEEEPAITAESVAAKLGLTGVTTWAGLLNAEVTEDTFPIIYVSGSVVNATGGDSEAGTSVWFTVNDDKVTDDVVGLTEAAGKAADPGAISTTTTFGEIITEPALELHTITLDVYTGEETSDDSKLLSATPVKVSLTPPTNIVIGINIPVPAVPDVPDTEEPTDEAPAEEDGIDEVPADEGDIGEELPDETDDGAVDDGAEVPATGDFGLSVLPALLPFLSLAFVAKKKK